MMAVRVSGHLDEYIPLANAGYPMEYSLTMPDCHTRMKTCNSLKMPTGACSLYLFQNLVKTISIHLACTSFSTLTIMPISKSPSRLQLTHSAWCWIVQQAHKNKITVATTTRNNQKQKNLHIC